jgi:hypothetical protein
VPVVELGRLASSDLNCTQQYKLRNSVDRGKLRRSNSAIGAQHKEGIVYQEVNTTDCERTNHSGSSAGRSRARGRRGLGGACSGADSDVFSFGSD